MAQYMLLLHQVPNYNADLPRERMLEMTKRYMAWADGLRQTACSCRSLAATTRRAAISRMRWRLPALSPNDACWNGA